MTKPTIIDNIHCVSLIIIFLFNKISDNDVKKVSIIV